METFLHKNNKSRYILLLHFAFIKGNNLHSNFDRWRVHLCSTCYFYFFYIETSIFIFLTTWLKHHYLHQQVVTEYQQDRPNSKNFVTSK